MFVQPGYVLLFLELVGVRVGGAGGAEVVELALSLEHLLADELKLKAFCTVENEVGLAVACRL